MKYKANSYPHKQLKSYIGPGKGQSLGSVPIGIFGSRHHRSPALRNSLKQALDVGLIEDKVWLLSLLPPREPPNTLPDWYSFLPPAPKVVGVSFRALLRLDSVS